MNKEHTIQPHLVELRRALHQCPEIGFQEQETRRMLIAALEEEGLEVHGPVGGTGFFVEIKGSSPGPCVAYRADMDGLPIRDEKQVAYASRNEGYGHMCGHDVHSSIAFGVACLLNERREQIAGRVRVFWQPAEEPNPSGAPEMIKDEILEGVEAVFGLHCDPQLSVGQICILPGMVTASFDKFDITLTASQSLHTARPHQGTDLMWVAHKIMAELYSLPGRLNNALNPCVIAVSKFQGGETHNVIPGQVSLGGTIRCARNDDRELIREHLENLLKSFGKLYNIESGLDIGKGAPPVRNDPELAAMAQRVIGEQKQIKTVYCTPSMGGEDFAHYTLQKPGLFMRLGTSSGPATAHPVHTSLFDIDESVLEPGSRLVAKLLEHYLQTMK